MRTTRPQAVNSLPYRISQVVLLHGRCSCLGGPAHGELALEVAAYLGGLEHLDEAREMLDDRYQGSFSSLAHWAEDFIEQTGALEGMPSDLQSYFNYEAYGRDADLGGDITVIESGSEHHVFWYR